MQIRIGDMWSVYPDPGLFVITTNGSMTKDGRLVMGAGIALQARERFPGLDRRLAEAIREFGRYENGAWLYGFLDGKKLGIFQAKRHWHERADLALIEQSAWMLAAWCSQNRDTPVNLNFPGIGFGRLSPEEVRPALRVLSNQVTIWIRE